MKNLNRAYWILTVVMLLDIGVYLFFGISFIGYWIDWLLFWTWLISTPIVIVLQFKKKWAIRYLISLPVLTILSIIPMGIPFLSVYAYATTLEQNRSYKVNGQFKVQESLNGVFAPLKIQVIRSYFVFEKVVADDVAEFKILDNHHYGLSDVESIKQIENTKNDSLLLAFKFKEGTVIKAFK